MKLSVSASEIEPGNPIEDEDEDEALEVENLDPVEIDLDDDGDDNDPDEQPDEDEDEPAPQEEPPEEDDELDPKQYSKSVRARIKREQRLKQEARERAEKAEAEAATLRQQLASLEVERDESGIEERLDAAKTKLKDARYESDIDKEAEALAEVQELTARRKAVEQRKASKESTSAEAPNPALDAWMKRNATWFQKKGFEIETQAALAANRQVADSRLSDDDPRYYARLDKILREKVRIPETPKPKPDVGGMRESDTAGVRGSKVTLGASDFKFMRSLGLDPTNKEHLREYAHQKKKEAA